MTPEMLPMIVTSTLAKGALLLSRKQVVVKRLDAIQNFGAMDVLCTDKTGTLTQDKVALARHADAWGADSSEVLNLAYLNSHYQTGLKNLLDRAVLDHVELAVELKLKDAYRKVDEVPFDFQRRRMSVVVAALQAGQELHHELVCKGAVEEVLAACTQVRAPVPAGADLGPWAQQAIPEGAVFSRVAADDLLPPTLLGAHTTKKAAAAASLVLALHSAGLFLQMRKLVAEFLDATAQVVNALLSAGIKRVGFAGGFQLDQRQFTAIFKLDVFACRGARPRHECPAIGEVLKTDFSVVGVNAIFHMGTFWSGSHASPMFWRAHLHGVERE